MRREAPDESANPPAMEQASQTPKLDRAFGRRLFREMVKMQIDDGPLRWRQRRELAKFARRIHIDVFEARLIMRAVEYECGVAAPAAMDDVETPADRQLVTQAEENLVNHAGSFLVPVGVLVAVMLAWVLASAF